MKRVLFFTGAKQAHKRRVILVHVVWITISLALLTSCATPEQRVDTPIDLPRGFSESGEKPLPNTWWRTLEDRKLNKLISDALDTNFDLKVAWARLDQARAVARTESATLWPQLDGAASVSRTVRENGADTASRTVSGSSSDSGRTYSDEFSLGLTASYEIDVWGKVRAATDAALLDAKASAADVRAAALSLTAQVATTWYQLVTQRAQLNLLEKQIATNRQYLDLVSLRFQKGAVSVTDVLQQRKLLEATRTEKERTRAGLRTLRHQLAVLLGEVPAHTSFPEKAQLPQLPSLPDTGVPAEVLRQRPDVRSAYLRLRSKRRSVAVAIAKKYPHFSISASFSSAAAEPSALLEKWLASLAGNMTAPILEGGRRQAEVTRSRAAAAQRLHAYGQTLLTAVREVEDALSNEQYQRRALRRIERQLRLSKATMRQLVRKYRNGTADFLHILDELRTLQTLQRQRLSAQFELVRHRINLYRALAGTWDLNRPDPAESGSEKEIDEG